MTTPVLVYDHVDISYQNRPVVQDVSFSVGKRDILAIVGESGSGKSALLKAAMDLLGPSGIVSRGDIWFDGQNLPDIDGAARQKLCGRHIAMVWQDAGAALCPIRTIGSQCVEMVRAHADQGEGEIKKRTLDLFGKLGFPDGERIWHSYAFELSGGMNQRVGVAMAMLLQPQVLLADEPTSALDVVAQKQVLDELLLLRKLYGTTMVLVTHDMGVVRKMADTVIVLQNGYVVEQGQAAQILQAPQAAYTQALLAAAPTLRRS